MSAEATRWAWHQLSIKSTTKILLLCLAARVPAGHRDVTMATSALVRWTSLNKKTVPDALHELEKEGLVEIERVPGGASTYRLNITEVGQ